MKTCMYWQSGHCSQPNPQPLANFNKRAKARDGLQSYCRGCSHKLGRKRYKEVTIEKRKANPDYYKDQRLKYHYGITLSQYEEMEKRQDGKCAVCRVHKDLLTRGLFVDHCHETKVVRDLLCNYCNSLLGHIEENYTTIIKLIKYKKTHTNREKPTSRS